MSTTREPDEREQDLIDLLLTRGENALAVYLVEALIPDDVRDCMAAMEIARALQERFGPVLAAAGLLQRPAEPKHPRLRAA